MAINTSTINAIKQLSLDSPEAIEELKSFLEESTPATREAIALEIHEFISQALGSSPAPRWSPPRESGTLAHIADLMPSMPSAVVVQGLVVQLSMDQDGCRLLQSALETGDGAERAAMSMEFYGHVCDALESPHAHHVLQLIVQLMPPSSVSFIIHEMQYKWSPTFVARHRFGCRVLERVIEHFPACPHAGAELAYFLEGILQDAALTAGCCYHSFSTFVMQHILEYGSVDQQRAIVTSLCSDLWKAALDMHAVGCLDKALSFQPFEAQVALASAILDSEGLLTRMALTRKGLPVARRLLRVIDGANLEQARRQLSGDAAKLARSKGGKALLSAAKLGDHAFTDASSDKSSVSNSNAVAPRQHLMLDSVIVSVPETDSAQMPSVSDKNSSFFAGMKDVEPYVPIVHAPVMQPMMQPYMMAGWVMCQGEDGNVLVPGQQQMVQVPACENNKAEPWWSSTVAQVTQSMWCNVAPEQASMMAD